jgi:hypothetical protein
VAQGGSGAPGRVDGGGAQGGNPASVVVRDPDRVDQEAWRRIGEDHRRIHRRAWRKVVSVIEGVAREVVGRNDQSFGDVHRVLGEILERLGERRKDVPKHVQIAHLNFIKHSDELQGRCPCCRVAVIVTHECLLDTAVAEFDHFHGVHQVESENVWPVCRGCHNRMDRTKGAEAARFITERAQPMFTTYQAAMKAAPAGQLSLVK